MKCGTHPRTELGAREEGVELPAHELTLDDLDIERRDLQRDAGGSLVKGRGDGRQQGDLAGVGQRDTEGGAGLRVEVVARGEERFDPVECLDEYRVHPAGRSCRRHPRAGAQEEIVVELPPKPSEGVRDGRLGEVQHLCGCRDRAGLVHGDERTDEIEVGCRHLPIIVHAHGFEAYPFDRDVDLLLPLVMSLTGGRPGVRVCGKGIAHDLVRHVRVGAEHLHR